MSLRSAPGWGAVLLGMLLPVFVASPGLAAVPHLDELEGLWRTSDGSRSLEIRPDGVALVGSNPFGWALSGASLLLRSNSGQIQRFQVDRIGKALTLQDREGEETHYLWVRAVEAPPEPRAVDRDDASFPFALRPSGGFRQVSRAGGVIRLESPQVPGSVLVVPARGLLTPKGLEKAAREGWEDASSDLRPRSPGGLLPIPLGAGQGGFFEAEGKLGGERVRGFLAGIFAPEGRSPHLVFAMAPPLAWRGFSPHARSMLESIRYQGEGASTPEPAGSSPSPAPLAGRGSEPGSSGPVRMVVDMKLPEGFHQSRGGEGVLYLTSAETSGAVLVLPARGVLTPEVLARANREGWKGNGWTLRALRPGMHQEIPLPEGSGYYFAVQGEVGGKSASGFLAGIFASGGRFPHLILTFSTPDEWEGFSGVARRMLDSLRFRPLE